MTGITATRGGQVLLIHDGTGAEVTCAASQAYTAANAGVLETMGARRLNIWLQVDYAAANDVVALLVMVSPATTKPAPGDDVWYVPAFFDGSVTAGTLAGAIPSGADYTAAPDFARCLHRQLEIRTEPADNATDELRTLISIDVSAARWVQVAYAQAVSTGAKVLAYYSWGSG
jgi:hypothetical protein